MRNIILSIGEVLSYLLAFAVFVGLVGIGHDLLPQVVPDLLSDYDPYSILGQPVGFLDWQFLTVNYHDIHLAPVLEHMPGQIIYGQRLTIVSATDWCKGCF